KELASSIAREVGAHVRSLREAGVDVAATKSSRTDVVTAADQSAEAMITSRLREARPADGLLGEEGASVASETGITWVVDPIDGTVNYLYGLPTYAVSVAATVEPRRDTEEDHASPAPPGLMADGRRAIAGAVYLPTTDELFSAFEGGGATLN